MSNQLAKYLSPQIYASIFSEETRSYLEAIGYRLGDEKMAVLLQRVAGGMHGNLFYPHISGLAQSYNYYPVSYLKPEDGITVIGFGLGKYVVDGEKSWRFCPKYPMLEFSSQDDIIKESQTSFHAIRMDAGEMDLAEGSDVSLVRSDISAARDHGTLDHCVSVYDTQSASIKTGTHYKGPMVMNFASILKYDYFPLATVVDAVLNIIKNSMGMPVQIEFAVDLDKNSDGKRTFYILQIKPLLGDMREFKIDLGSIDRDDLLLYSERAMGNGTLEGILDIIYVIPETFDRSRTVEMKTEIKEINHVMRDEGRKYILIGPGRWGSRDSLLGIPTRWSDISNAAVIVEVELEDFHFDASLGSHFFHNITSQGIGYFAVPFGSKKEFVDWDWLSARAPYKRTKHLVHVRLDKPLTVRMDGRKGISLVTR